MTSVAQASQTVTTEYNGWTNRETWLTNLWLNNDIGSYEQLQEICRKDCELREKAEELEAQFQDQLEDMYDYPTFWSDIIGTALDRVDWQRIVEANEDSFDYAECPVCDRIINLDTDSWTTDGDDTACAGCK